MSWNESHACLYLYILIAVAEKNSGAFPYDLEYTGEKLVASHSYEILPKAICTLVNREMCPPVTQKSTTNFISRRFRDWQSPDEIIITYFSRSETAAIDHWN